jgi:hypothetical protein
MSDSFGRNAAPSGRLIHGPKFDFGVAFVARQEAKVAPDLQEKKGLGMG